MVTQSPRLSVLAVAAIFALTCFGAILFVWKSFGGSAPLEPQGWRFHARFDKPVVSNADARISGIKVGRVIKSRPLGGRIDVLIELQPRYAPLPTDARAIIRTKTLLGETFVELTPGTPGAPKLAEGGTLAPSQIERTQELDQVLGAFDQPTRRAFKRMLADFSSALRGRSGDLNSAVGNARPTVENLTALADLLDRRQADVTRLISSAGVTLRSLGRRSYDLQGVVIEGNRVLATTAARDDQLTRTVRELPAFLAELRRTLVVADATAGDAAPTLRALRPVAPLVRPALQETTLLAPDLQALFLELGPVLDAAHAGLPRATRVIELARPLVEVLHDAGRQLVPVVQLLELYRRELIAPLANIGAATQGSMILPDGSRRHYLRALPPLTNEMSVGYAQRPPSNRHNPYFKHGALQRLADGPLRAWDCDNVDNPLTVPTFGPGAPPCLVQRPWPFRGESRSYPHVEAAQR